MFDHKTELRIIKGLFTFVHVSDGLVMNKLDSISVSRQCLHDDLGSFQRSCMLWHKDLRLQLAHQINGFHPEQRISEKNNSQIINVFLNI